MNISQQARLLGATEEAGLARRAYRASTPDAIAARNELVLCNLGLAGKAASFYTKKYHTDYDDLFSEAVVALTEAAGTFNPDRGKRFASYAMLIMMNALRHFVFADRVVRVPNWMQDPAELARERARPRSERSRQNLESCIAAGQRALKACVSISRDEATLPMDQALSPIEALQRQEAAGRVLEAIRAIPVLQAMVLVHRFGLCGLPSMSVPAVAAALGLSIDRVRDIERTATAALGRLFSDETPRSRCA